MWQGGKRQDKMLFRLSCESSLRQLWRPGRAARCIRAQAASSRFASSSTTLSLSSSMESDHHSFPSHNLRCFLRDKPTPYGWKNRIHRRNSSGGRSSGLPTSQDGTIPRTSLLMQLTDRVGILHDVLRWFWKFDVNICRIESRPVSLYSPLNTSNSMFDMLMDCSFASGKRGDTYRTTSDI